MITKVYSIDAVLNFRLSQVPVWTDDHTADVALYMRNDTNDRIPVYSSALWGANVDVPYQDILITFLGPMSELYVKAVVKHGTPKTHVLFRVVCCCIVEGSTITIETVGTRTPDQVMDAALKMI